MITILNAHLVKLFSSVNIKQCLVNFLILFGQVSWHFICLVKIVIAVVVASVIFVTWEVCTSRIRNNFDDLLNRAFEFGTDNIFVNLLRQR